MELENYNLTYILVCHKLMKRLQLDLKLHIGAIALWYAMKQETGNHQKRK